MNILEIIGKRIAIDCSTQEEWDGILGLFNNSGVRWMGGEYASDNYGDHFWGPENTCISGHAGCLAHSSREFYEEAELEILPASQFLIAPPDVDMMELIDSIHKRISHIILLSDPRSPVSIHAADIGNAILLLKQHLKTKKTI